MSSPTILHIPRIGRWRASTTPASDSPAAPGATMAANTGAGHAQESALMETEGADASVALGDMDELRRRRMQRVATIIAASLIVSAIVSGAATVIARRAAQRRTASAPAS